MDEVKDRIVSNPRVLVLGGTGMLGHKLFQVMRERFPRTICTTRKDVRHPPFDRVELLQGGDVISGVDVMDIDRLRDLLAELQPDYVVNCVGIIKQRDESKSAIPSITVNSLLPHKLAAVTKQWGGRLIHFSTDCVFSGNRGGYSEEDDSDAEDLYGKSKFLGEVDTENALTLRTSIIGRELVEHKSLLDWFLSQNHKTVKGFKRVIYSGVTTNQMAEVITYIIQKHPTLSGRYQVVSDPISKYDLLCLLRDAYCLDIEITPDETVVSDRSMKGDRFRSATGYVSPPWHTLVKNLSDDPTPYDRWITA
jgi:dTDP-4-dehydrorhamnose reductase